MSASKGYVESLLNTLADDIKRALMLAFRHVLDNLGFGGPGDRERAANFAWYRFDGVTSSVAGTEFSIAHSQGVVPTFCFQVLPLGSSGTEIVRLKASRAADASRVYFTSVDTGAAFTLMIEF